MMSILHVYGHAYDGQAHEREVGGAVHLTRQHGVAGAHGHEVRRVQEREWDADADRQAERVVVEPG